MAAGIACGKLDINQLSNDNILVGENKAWVKADVEHKIYVYKKPTDTNAKPYVVIKFEEGCYATICSDTTEVMPTLQYFAAAINANNNGGNDPNAPAQPDPEGKDKEEQAKTICGVDKDLLINAQKRLDSTSINDRGFQAAAVIPAAAIIPMKSNIISYGPYASSNFATSCGGTQVEVNTDLCPWVFGSLANMHAAGNSIVENMAIGLVRAENGSVTIAGLPSLASLGATVSSGGPNLTDISFSFGTNGVTTTYQFRTYTPKFGSLNRHFLDRFKVAAKNRFQQIKFLRNAFIGQNKINRQINRFNRKYPQNAIGLPRGLLPSLNRVMMGEIYDWQQSSEGDLSQRTVVGMDTLAKSVAEMRFDYDKKAYMSMDGLFGPVSKSGDGNLPRFFASTASTGHLSSPVLPQPPIQNNGDCSTAVSYNSYKLDLTQPYFDPLKNSFTSGHHHTGAGLGHVVDIVGRKATVPRNGLMTNFYGLYDDDRYSSDYRFLGMRGPIVLHSWGYDLDGKPIPNEADTENNTKNGTFTSSSLKDKFLKDWLQKPKTWPVAPIDLRFDRKRGVWVSPQPYKIVVLKIIKEVPAFGTGRGVLVNYGDTLYDADGNSISTTTDACCDNAKNCNWLDVVTNVCLTPQGLVIKKQKVRVSDISDTCCSGIIPITSCDSSSSSSSINECPCYTIDCSSSSSSSSCTPSTDIDGLVSVADRIGNRHKAGCYVYAYYDTSTSIYIVLQN